MMYSSSLPLLLSVIVLVQFCILGTARPNFPRPPEESPQFWRNLAKENLANADKLFTNQLKLHRAKNVILFIGDGMGITTVTAARIFKGQLAGRAGDGEKLSFEEFPHLGLAKTYNTDMQTPDSAGTATAFLCGVKANFATLGVDEFVQKQNCSSYTKSSDVTSFLENAADAGKSAGIVTTTRLTHATPAAAYAHTPFRDWEDDTDRNKGVSQQLREQCPDIAQQLVRKSSKYSVMFGGGRLKFLPQNFTTTDQSNSRKVNGSRSDGQNLIAEWEKVNANRRHKYLETTQELQALKPADYDTVLGIFSTSHMQYHYNNINNANYKEPSLSDMATKAIDILSKNQEGFALLVEGGRIDHAHHENLAKFALHDAVAFDEAIAAVLKKVNLDETLVIVTADHSHVFSVGGWARRGSPILGKVDFNFENRYNSKGEALADDAKPFLAVYYANGPSAAINQSRADITDVDVESADYKQQSLVPMGYESHGSEDVAIYATGPGAHLFHKTSDQSYIGNAVKHAVCVGEFAASGNCLAEKSAAAAGAAANVATLTSSIIAIVLAGLIY